MLRLLRRLIRPRETFAAIKGRRSSRRGGGGRGGALDMHRKVLVGKSHTPSRACRMQTCKHREASYVVGYAWRSMFSVGGVGAGRV